MRRATCGMAACFWSPPSRRSGAVVRVRKHICNYLQRFALSPTRTNTTQYHRILLGSGLIDYVCADASVSRVNTARTCANRFVIDWLHKFSRTPAGHRLMLSIYARCICTPSPTRTELASRVHSKNFRTAGVCLYVVCPLVYQRLLLSYSHANTPECMHTDYC